jgi:hypothetical protein
VQAALAAARASTPPPLPPEAAVPQTSAPALETAERSVTDSVQAAMAAFATEEIGNDLADEDEPAEQTQPSAPAQAEPTTDLADEDDADEALTEEALQERVAQALGDTGLPPEDEAELLAELTAVEREAESLRRAERERRAALRDEGADAAADRLARDADSQFSDADAQRRQSTISHLKAAVLATRADEEAGEGRSPEAEEEREIARYRADLEQTVQRPAPSAPGGEDGTPRRPVRGGAHRTERPRNAQPPLVLVSEQRIDRPRETEFVQPRRINTGALAMEELYDEDENTAPAPNGRAFIDFVAPMHLTTLAELTEAAAAYVSEVEGVDEFTRPQVMRHVAATGLPMARSRENMLRTFGLLMRQGTMSRANRGQYALTPDSEFRDQARRFATGA